MFNCVQLDQPTVRAPLRPDRVYTRYAIYYTPQPGTALAAFGRSWFGRANDGVTLQAFSDAGLSGTSFAKLAVAPGRYTGLHALFRAPFALRDGIGLDAIKTRLINFAATAQAGRDRASDLVALRPLPGAAPGRGQRRRSTGSPRNASLRSRISPRRRATPSARNMPSPELSDYQRLLLESFGDPYVLSEYRFSITLTGPLDATHLERVSQALWPVLEEICASGVTVDGLSLFGDAGGRTPMRLIGRYHLGA